MTHDFVIIRQLELAREKGVITPADEIFTLAWLTDRYELKNKPSHTLRIRVVEGRERAERVILAAQIHGSPDYPLEGNTFKGPLGAPRSLLLMAGSRYYPAAAEDIVSCMHSKDRDDAIAAAKKLVEGDIWLKKTYKNGRVNTVRVDWALVYDLTNYQVIWQGGETTARDMEDMPVSVLAVDRPEGM